MKAPVTIIFALLFLTASAFAFPSRSQKEGDQQRLIAAARFLEEKPLEKNSKDIRRWAITWIIQTDKVSVKPCTLILRGVEEKYKYSSELFGQYTIGMAAFELANPDKASDEDAVQLAGLEGSINSYQAMLKAQSKAQNDFMDELVAKRGNGTLAEYVKAHNCKDKQ